VTAASPGTLGEVSGHAFSTRASLPPQVEALVDVIQDPIGQIEFLRELIPARIDERMLIDADDASRMVRGGGEGGRAAGAPRGG
jgi:hypothetical protein